MKFRLPHPTQSSKCGSDSSNTIVSHFQITQTLNSVVTSPFYTVGIAMQLSVIPHLTIYGDVKPEQIKRGLLRATTDKILQIGYKAPTEL